MYVAAPVNSGICAAKRSVEASPTPGVRGFTMNFDRNEEIFGEEEDADFVYQMISGAARTFRVLSDGRRQVVRFHFPGDVMGVERRARHRVSAEAVNACVVALIRRSELDKAARSDAATARWLWDQATDELEHLKDHMMLLGRKSAAEKVAAFLLAMAARTGGGAVARLPMSRSDIADYLGLTVETISRTLTQFERDGAIAMTSSRCIAIRRRELLTSGEEGRGD
jgi:CRP/FNR family transcriptional regulator/CRP/FNR family nitrogen fixation transcriptional regulator